MRKQLLTTMLLPSLFAGARKNVMLWVVAHTNAGRRSTPNLVRLYRDMARQAGAPCALDNYTLTYPYSL